MSDEPATKDFIDRVINAERLLTDEKFRSRDEAVRLLVASSKDDQAKYIAIAGVILGAISVIITVLKFASAAK
jgi:hypothetical protein